MTHQALYNFGAGPAMLPAEVVRATAQAVTNYQGMGISLMEMGHRTPQFKAVMVEAQDLMRELLHIPATHSVLFLGGGARLQFSMVPMNLLKHKAAYLDSGHWAHQAMTRHVFGVKPFVWLLPSRIITHTFRITITSLQMLTTYI